MGCDFNIVRPWIFVVEVTKTGTSILSHEGWETILIDHGYILGYNKGIDRYYVDPRREYLLDYFENTDKFITENEIVRMSMIKGWTQIWEMQNKK
ncbi:MAG: hypothetical protein LUI12_12160 [Clostridiales bacterium]|nr:hypothetical protein [Clostridiales bacterium]